MFIASYPGSSHKFIYISSQELISTTRTLVFTDYQSAVSHTLHKVTVLQAVQFPNASSPPIIFQVSRRNSDCDVLCVLLCVALVIAFLCPFTHCKHYIAWAVAVLDVIEMAHEGCFTVIKLYPVSSVTCILHMVLLKWCWKQSLWYRSSYCWLPLIWAHSSSQKP